MWLRNICTAQVRLQARTAEGRVGCFCVNNPRNCCSHPRPRHTDLFSGSHEQLCSAVSKCLSAAVYEYVNFDRLATLQLSTE